MNVALVKPPIVRPYWFKSKPSLGIGYLYSYLTAHGIHCKIFDANFNAWKEKRLIHEIIEFDPEFIGISAMTHEIVASHSLACKLHARLKNIPTIIGGCHIIALPAQTLKEFPFFSYGVYGEGEKTFLQLLNHLKNNDFEEHKNEIKGLIYKDNRGEIIVNPPPDRLTSAELDALPFPPVDQYYKSKYPLRKKHEYYSMITTRGCPYRCAFCMQALGREVIKRSPENIIKEMRHAHERFGAHTIYFEDEIFLFNDERTTRLLGLLQETDLPSKLRWRATTRVDLVSKNLISDAKKAGCFCLNVGVESGSEKILKAINKDISIADVRKAVKIIKEAQISLDVNFIIGHPYETTETIKETMELAADLNPTLVSCGILTPFPGTKIYEMAKNGQAGLKLLTNDWEKYDRYGGKALESSTLPIKELEKWQRQFLIFFYFKNKRYLDFIKFIISFRHMLISLLFQRVSGNLYSLNPFNRNKK